MALIALDIPAPDWPESSIEETISRAYSNERNEAAPLRQVRRSALLCKACWPAAALLSLCLPTPAPSRRDSLLFLFKSECNNGFFGNCCTQYYSSFGWLLPTLSPERVIIQMGAFK
jgi:hypothetical protein